jgi:hypothetical protein
MPGIKSRIRAKEGTKSSARYPRRGGESSVTGASCRPFVDAEGGIRLYRGNGIADSVLYITTNKFHLLTSLKHVFGGRLYFHERAWRLVLYGKVGANRILDRTTLKHDEKIEKSAFVRAARGQRWNKVDDDRSSTVRGIHAGVLRYGEGAKAEYMRIHGRPHSNDRSGA